MRAIQVIEGLMGDIDPPPLDGRVKPGHDDLLYD